jgi:two-component system LytT family response regulator/two-component system response regulator LytT
MDLRTVIVDDEQLAREELCFQLERVGGVDVVGQAKNGVEALRVIEDHEPDLILLDVQMPGLTGFEVARRLVDKRVDAQIVFVTAFDQYALEAFEVNAVDYLLKPVEPKRLEQAIDRVRRRVTTDRPARQRGHGSLGKDELERLIQLVAERTGRSERIAQLAVKVGERFLLMSTDDIVHAFVADDVMTVVTGTVAGTSNYGTLDELQGHLDPDVFWRVHRSHLVNIHKIKEIVPWFSRNYILKMKDAKGSEIPVSRAQTRRLREYLRL